jgi:hypothetical protein
MSYAFVQVLPGFSAEAYARVVQALGDEPYEGLIVHLAGPCAVGWRIIEVWRSEDDYVRFERNRLRDALVAVDAFSGTSPPQFEWLELAHIVVGEPDEIHKLSL